MKSYAKVLINLPVEGPFDYRIPPAMSAHIEIGKRVWVSFGPRRVIGYVIDISAASEIKEPKPVLSVIDEKPINLVPGTLDSFST